MGLKDILLLTSYNSRKQNVIEDFYLPCFQNSVLYNRSTAYFTSTILRWVSRGIEDFVSAGGKMQLVCSPYLNKEDIGAIKTGYCDREKIITGALDREIEKIDFNLVDDNLNLLSWLIKNERLNIKIACVKNITEDGLFHQKIGIFQDSNADFVVFAGSNNETERAIIANYEQFDVYKSWNDLEDRCKEKIDNFDEIWNGQDPNLKIYDFPDALKEKIIARVRPQSKIARKDSAAEPSGAYVSPASAPKISQENFLNSLWWFQTDAIKEFFSNGCRGLFSMATGTGKTRTAIGTLFRLLQKEQKLFIVIVAPQNTILKQWGTEIDSTDLKYKKVIGYNNTAWKDDLFNAAIDFKMGVDKCCIVYTTYAAYHRDDFKSIIREKVEKNLFLICDEVHSSGAETYQNGLLDEYGFRLGLSATPKRHFDDEGTDLVLKYFSKVVFEFSLKDALETDNPSTGKPFLCPYYYHPILVKLTDTEHAEYISLSNKIKKYFASNFKDADDKTGDSYLDSLYLKRAKILQNAENKLGEFSKLLEKIEPEFLIIFSSDKQISLVHNILNNRNIKHSQFTCEESFEERQGIIEQFEKKECKAILAIMCLDEGVDIPRAEHAVLMSSSTNPKQYIQRRGRLLRRHKDKVVAYIYDMIVIPSGPAGKNDQVIIKKEFERYVEFAGLAKNSTESVNLLYDSYKKMGVI